jgi:hypothetical protein
MPEFSSFAEGFVKGLSAAGVAFEDDGGQLRIPARHPEVGDLLITFDDSEITVFVGNFTHRHFTPEAEDCVRDALDYVWGILNDQWILWAYPGGAGGSYRVGTEDDPKQDAPPPDETVIRYLWSGPFDSRPGQTPDRTRVQ